MDANEVLLDSWTRQCKALENLLGLFSPDLLRAKPSEASWDVAYHLCHLHEVRCFWLARASGREDVGLRSLYTGEEGTWLPSYDLSEIRHQLAESEAAIHDWVANALESGRNEAGYYDHPVLFLQHMIWHEGYHFGLLMLALRVAGHEPSEELEDAHIWDLWRQPG